MFQRKTLSSTFNTVGEGKTVVCWCGSCAVLPSKGGKSRKGRRRRALRHTHGVTRRVILLLRLQLLSYFACNDSFSGVGVASNTTSLTLEQITPRSSQKKFPAMPSAQDSPKQQEQPQQPPRKPKTTRSRNGCWTCRSRKKKCDETRPECMQCLNKGLKCEGYEARLKWGNGVASRGYLKGMNCPIMVVGGGPTPTAAASMAAAETGTGTGTGAGSAPNKKGARGGRGGGGAKESRETSCSDSDMRGSSGKGSSGESQAETEDSTSPQSTASSSPSLSSFDQNLMRECMIPDIRDFTFCQPNNNIAL